MSISSEIRELYELIEKKEQKINKLSKKLRKAQEEREKLLAATKPLIEQRDALVEKPLCMAFYTSGRGLSKNWIAETDSRMALDAYVACERIKKSKKDIVYEYGTPSIGKTKNTITRVIDKQEAISIVSEKRFITIEESNDKIYIYEY